MNYRISDLKNFLEASAHPTMAQASRQLEISQPALSESIKRLESDLNVVLFYRTRSGVQLTNHGRSVADLARAAIAQLNELELVSSPHLQFNNRVIHIGAHPVVASYILPKALKALGQSIPDFKIKLTQASSRNIQALVQQGRLDVGLVINPISVPDLVIKVIASDEVGVWGNPKGHLNKLICNPEMFQTDSILRKWKKAPQDRIETDNLELIVRLVSEGIGYGILPKRAIDLLDVSLKHYTEFPSYKDRVSLVYRPEFGKNETEKVLIKALSEAVSG